MPATVRRPPLKVRPRIKVWLELDPDHAFCSGMCRILQAIDKTGSIKQASAEVGRSYRFVWGRLKRVEQAFGVPLVDAHVGGGKERRSTLTPAGRSLMQHFARLQAALLRTADDAAADLQREIRKAFD